MFLHGFCALLCVHVPYAFSSRRRCVHASLHDNRRASMDTLMLMHMHAREQHGKGHAYHLQNQNLAVAGRRCALLPCPPAAQAPLCHSQLWNTARSSRCRPHLHNAPLS